MLRRGVWFKASEICATAHHQSGIDSSMVFFVDATTTASLDASLTAIAKSKGSGLTAQDAINWLSHINNDYFILIDNADDAQISLHHYLPHSTMGLILITSRLQHAGKHYGTGPDASIVVPDLDLDEATELLINTANLPNEQYDEAKALVQELYGFALAVAQAGAGMLTMNMSITEYTEAFHDLRLELMDGEIDGVKPSGLDGYHSSAFTTWKLSLSKLSPLAASLLRICAYLHHNGIRENMFKQALSDLSTYSPSVPLSRSENIALDQVLRSFYSANNTWSQIKFKRCIHEVCSYSLMYYDAVTASYSIHPLIQDWLRTEVDDIRPTTFLLAGAARQCFEDVRESLEIGPHVERILVSYGKGKEGTSEMHPDVTYSFAVNLWETQQFSTAELVGRHAYRQYSKALGDEHPSTMRALGNAADTLWSLGRFSEALEMQSQVLDKRKKIFGDDRDETILALSKMASTLHSLSRFSEAGEMRRQVLEKRNKLLGDNHPKTISALGSLATTLQSLGQFTEALEMRRQVLDKQKKLFGDDHPNTIFALGNLAITPQLLGRFTEVEEMQRQVLDKLNKLFGHDHHETIYALGNLAITLRSLGQFTEAEEMQRQVLDKLNKLFGDNHPKTVFALSNLAITLRSLGQFTEAEEMQRQVLAKRKMLLGDDHPSTIQAMSNLAITISKATRYREAAGMFRQLLARCIAILGENHPMTVNAREHLTHTVHLMETAVDATPVLSLPR